MHFILVVFPTGNLSSINPVIGSGYLITIFLSPCRLAAGKAVIRQEKRRIGKFKHTSHTVVEVGPNRNLTSRDRRWVELVLMCVEYLTCNRKNNSCTKGRRWSFSAEPARSRLGFNRIYIYISRVQANRLKAYVVVTLAYIQHLSLSYTREPMRVNGPARFSPDIVYLYEFNHINH